MREVVNGIVYDPEIFDKSWPDLQIACWLCIRPKGNNNSERKAILVASSDYENKSIIVSDIDVPETSWLGEIIWFEPENSEIFYINGLYVSTEYWNNNIGYFLGVAMHTWFAMNEKKLLMMPPPSPDHRSEFVELMIKKWCIEYQDDFTKFLAEDGNYYYYSEWINLNSNL